MEDIIVMLVLIKPDDRRINILVDSTQ